MKYLDMGKAKSSHPKCYAKDLFNCSEQITREHYISNCLLELFEEKKTVLYAGHSTKEPQTFNLFSRDSLASKVLCKKHNQDLSTLDNEGCKFLRTIHQFDEDFNAIAPISESKYISGSNIEKWLLKTVCSLISAKQIKNGEGDSFIIKEEYVQILFCNAKWPRNWGLYYVNPEEEVQQKFNCFSVQALSIGKEIKAVDFWIQNFRFILLLDHQMPVLCKSIYRPTRFNFKKGSINKNIKFQWDGWRFPRIVTFDRVGTTNLPPDEWPDWAKKTLDT